jgi:hypothetical protein
MSIVLPAATTGAVRRVACVTDNARAAERSIA